jgi:hypothetical protein
MNALQAVVTVCVSVLLVLTAIGIQSLQAWLEQWDYDRQR